MLNDTFRVSWGLRGFYPLTIASIGVIIVVLEVIMKRNRWSRSELLDLLNEEFSRMRQSKSLAGEYQAGYTDCLLHAISMIGDTLPVRVKE